MAQLYPFSPSRASAVPIEVQTLEERHREWDVRPHGHAFFEIIVVTSGTIQDAAFIIPPGAIHDCREFGIADGIVIRFLADGVDAAHAGGLSLHDDIPTGMVFDVFRRPVLDLLAPLVLETRTHARLLAHAERMREELEQRRAGYDVVVRSELQTVLVELARNVPATSPPVDAPQQRELVRRVFADIDAHFTDRETLSAAAQRLGLSAGYLTTQLRRLTGKTYGDWVIERRMIEARRLLIVTDDPIGEIAGRVGYAESESFVRRFRERHAVTPAAWRDKSRSTVA